MATGMSYADLTDHLRRHGVRLGLKLVVECPEPGTLTEEARAALAEHKPLVVARVASALQRGHLETWAWGSQPEAGAPPF